MEVTDLLGFPPGMLDPGLKIAETRIFETNAADRGGADRKVALGPTPFRARARFPAGTYGSRKEKHKGGGQMCGVFVKAGAR
jgi:hypothetical protein